MKAILVLFGVIVLSGCIGIDEPIGKPQKFSNLSYINASNITAIGSALSASGPSTSDPYNMTNISEIDNLNFSLIEGTSPFYINITFTNITNFSYLETKSMYFATTGAPTQHEVDIEMWCITEGEFVDVSSLTSHIEWFYFTRRFPDSSHFIDERGNVTVRFNHSDSGNTNHRLLIDVVRLAVQPQFQKVNINSTINYITQGATEAGTTDHFNLTNKSLSDHNVTENLNLSNFGIRNLTDIKKNQLNMSWFGDNFYFQTPGTFFYDFAGLPEIYRNGSGVLTLRTSPLATINLVLAVEPGGIGGGGGPALIFWNRNLTRKVSDNLGRLAIVYDNASYTMNTSIVSIYGRDCINYDPSAGGLGALYCTQGLKPIADFYAVNQTLIVYGNITVKGQVGSGNAYVCVDSTGNQYRGNPGC